MVLFRAFGLSDARAPVPSGLCPNRDYDMR